MEKLILSPSMFFLAYYTLMCDEREKMASGNSDDPLYLKIYSRELSLDQFESLFNVFRKELQEKLQKEFYEHYRWFMGPECIYFEPLECAPKRVHLSQLDDLLKVFFRDVPLGIRCEKFHYHWFFSPNCVCYSRNSDLEEEKSCDSFRQPTFIFKFDDFGHDDLGEYLFVIFGGNETCLCGVERKKFFTYVDGDDDGCWPLFTTDCHVDLLANPKFFKEPFSGDLKSAFLSAMTSALKSFEV